MKEIIRKLAEQSGFVFWSDEPHSPGIGKIDWSCDYESEFNKMVELIVLECASVCENFTCDSKPLTDVSSAIKRHFEIQGNENE